MTTPDLGRMAQRVAYTQMQTMGSATMIILGIILVILCYLLPQLSILITIGVILIVLGVILWILGATGHPIAGRARWY
jgi:Family of unknown function (DUF6131)